MRRSVRRGSSPSFFTLWLQNADEILVERLLTCVGLGLVHELQVAPIDPAQGVRDLDEDEWSDLIAKAVLMIWSKRSFCVRSSQTLLPLFDPRHW